MPHDASAVGYRNLIAWQRAMELAANVHSLMRSLRQQRHADLATQLSRAAVSVPANIAEGRGRGSPKEFARFLRIATGSLREVETLILLADRLHLTKQETTCDLLKQADEVGKVLFGLIRAANSGSTNTRRPMPPSDV